MCVAGFRSARMEDIDELAPIMKGADRIEVFCSHGMLPEEALEYSYVISQEVNTIHDEEEKVIGMFGYNLDDDGLCVPWMLSSDDLRKIRFKFFRESKVWMDGVRKEHSAGYNYAHAGNTESIKWLKWLGIKDFEYLEKWGYYPSPFVKFSWTDKKES